MKAYKVRVEGRVQGVCFRHYTHEKANELGISGWVRNCSDGSVEALICGDDAQLDTMLSWLRHGPSSAVVTNTDIEPVEPETGASGFRITN